MSFNEISKNNLKLLVSLKEDDKLSSNKIELHIQDGEYINVDDELELEYSIYFTFHELFLMKLTNNYKDKVRILNDINISINNIYNNHQLNQMISENERFHKIICDIDEIYDIIYEKEQNKGQL